MDAHQVLSNQPLAPLPTASPETAPPAPLPDQPEAGAAAPEKHSWTEARVERLKLLWADGMSASMIAADLGLGLTRNAVIGKVNRLGLSDTMSPEQRAQRRSNTAPRARGTRTRKASTGEASQPDAYEPVDVSPPDPQFMCTLATLEADMCRAPVGDPSTDEFRFCGTPTLSTRAYCAFHQRMFYQAGSARGARVNAVAETAKAAALEYSEHNPGDAIPQQVEQ
jgi:GcrA cell cycle regulator